MASPAGGMAGRTVQAAADWALMALSVGGVAWPDPWLWCQAAADSVSMGLWLPTLIFLGWALSDTGTLKVRTPSL